MYRGLDSLRALAFLGVFAFHCGLLPFGYLGVQAFFVLSGFLLTPILITMKEQLDSRRYFINFYGRRSLRIFPLYFLYTLTVLIICLIIVNTKNYSGIQNIERYLAQIPWTLTYTYDFFHATRFFRLTQLCSHFWSLAIEEQFYLLWPALIWLVNKKHLKYYLITIITIGPVLRLLIVAMYNSGNFPFLLPDLDQLIYVLPFSHFDAFAIGGYFALYTKSDKTNLRTLGLLYFSILIGYLAQYISNQTVDVQSLGYTAFLQDQYILGYSIINFTFAKLINQIKDRKFFPSLIENSIFVYLGKISYGLYVFHHSLIWFVGFINPTLQNYQVAVIALTLTILISSLVYELYEKKFLNWKDKYFPKTSLTS